MRCLKSEAPDPLPKPRSSATSKPASCWTIPAWPRGCRSSSTSC